jgi:ubiquinone biosynthesis protein
MWRRRLRLLLRLIAIQRVLLKHGLDEIVYATHLFRPLGWVSRVWPSRKARSIPLGVRLRLACEELGPIFVKFGQAVSTRRDLLPADVADELVKLQDRVPPFPSRLAVAMVEEALGREIGALFREFDTEPLAAASIAQVHAAKLLDGRDVVVKLLRPQVQSLVKQDIEVLYTIAQLAETYWPASRRLNPSRVVAEFEKSLANELDLMREAANAAQLKRNFADSEQLYVPEVHWDYCRNHVLTIERIRGIPIGDVEALRACGADIRRLAENGVDIFFTQVFRHNFFHADMHPGNIFVDVRDPARPRYLAVDFGIVGTLSARDQQYLAENFLAFFERDYRRVADLHIDSGWVPPQTRADELEAAVRAVCEPIFDRPLKDISFGLVLLRLFETARRFDMQVQPQLVLLQKTLLNIEGLGRQLYPELDLWRTAKPILEQWMHERMDVTAHLKRIYANWPRISSDLMLAPGLLHRWLRGLDAAAFAVPTERERRPMVASDPAGRRTLQGTGLLLAGVLWIGLGAAPAWPGAIAMGVGIALMFMRPFRPL